MAKTRSSASLPPFPTDIPTIELARISAARLLSNSAASDMAAATAEADSLFTCCRDTGFFLLDLHGLPHGADEPPLADAVQQAFAISRAWYALPLAEREAYSLSGGNTGYKPLGMLSVGDGKKDRVEITSVRTDDISAHQQLWSHNQDPETEVSATMTANRYAGEHINGHTNGHTNGHGTHPARPLPAHFATHAADLAALASRLSRLADALLAVLEARLHLSSGAGTLAALHRGASDTNLRFLRYPAVPLETAAEAQVSLTGHTDNGSLTILFAPTGGLQVLPPGAPAEDANDPRSEHWLFVRPEDGCAVVNVGDALTQWTGGLLRSAAHRVVPAPGEQREWDRYSLGFFLKPAEEASMRRLRGADVPPEEEGDEEQANYKEWHAKKSKKLFEGKGGLGMNGNGR